MVLAVKSVAILSAVSSSKLCLTKEQFKLGQGSMSHRSGFTLVELMITLAIAAILALVGAPMLGDFLDNSRGFHGGNEIASALRSARGEAVSRQRMVRVCAWDWVNEQCIDSADWRGGVGVFVDNDGDGVRDANDRIIKTVRAADDRDFVQSSVAQLTFTAEGQVQGMVAANIRYCPKDINSRYRREVLLAGAGRVTLVRGDNAGQCSLLP